MNVLISHFSWKPLFKKEKLPGWRISFYWQGTHYEGIYHKSGDIEWGHTHPGKEEPALVKELHELMLYHIYD
ncbi:YheE family protein [Bacillus siamensis]|uniref:YheE family protein n=1 Tax=Bacillus siamensis TaxID=659243 RepID=UPI0022B79BA8|nr:YheE family protein [Bacillus siamensis]